MGRRESRPVNILGIETSCDETSAAVVRDGNRVRSNVVASQVALHRAHGGVVPELAARGHITAIVPVVEAALREAGIARPEIDAVAVTGGPGLAGSLLVGVNVGKTLAYALDKPLIPVNHLEGHIYANWLTLSAVDPPPKPQFPVLCLLVSGGHSELILVEDHGRYRHLGRTRDDAAGEAFDKGARLLGLGYPGGPVIQRAAQGGDPDRFAMPRAWLGESDDFSFSGLKTALLRLVEPYRLPSPTVEATPESPFVVHQPPRYRDDLPVADLAAAYQTAIVEVLAVKTARAARREGARTIALAGGVAANEALRARIAIEAARECAGNPPPVVFPPVSLCTDNAAMIAGAGFWALREGRQGGWEVDVHPRLPLGSANRAND